MGTGDNPAGAPPLDCWFDVYDVSAGAFDEHDTWTITTQPSSLAHYAMWPAKLAERLILMMCPAEVCATCGTPNGRRADGTGDVAHVPRTATLPQGRCWADFADAAVSLSTSGTATPAARRP